MKKLLALLMAFAMIFAIVGCSENAEDNVKKYVSNYKKSDEYKEAAEAAESMGAEFNVIADGENIVYKYKYNIEVDEGAKERIEESLESNDYMMESAADQAREECDGLKYLILEYYDVDDELICDFKY